MPECPECKDASSSYFDLSYKPYCKIVENSVPKSKFDCYCNKYPRYKECDYYKKKYR
jgi:hypothetical protein